MHGLAGSRYLDRLAALAAAQTPVTPVDAGASAAGGGSGGAGSAWTAPPAREERAASVRDPDTGDYERFQGGIRFGPGGGVGAEAGGEVGAEAEADSGAEAGAGADSGAEALAGAGVVDRVYLAGSGPLQTFAAAELHYHPTAAAEGPALPATDLDGPRSPGGGGGGGFMPPPPPPKMGSFSGRVARGTSPAPPALSGGVATVEATCHRAANTTWSDATPSPDLVVLAGRGIGSGNNEGEGGVAPKAVDILCICPGLISQPVASLVNGRMTLTQIITFHE